jgi:hypothetical protein
MSRHRSGDPYNTLSTVQDKFTSSLMDLGDCGGKRPEQFTLNVTVMFVERRWRWK